jgi:hypothetical protein
VAVVKQTLEENQNILESNKQGKELTGNFQSIAQMAEHCYSNPEVSGSSPGSVQFSLPISQKYLEMRN